MYRDRDRESDLSRMVGWFVYYCTSYLDTISHSFIIQIFLIVISTALCAANNS